MKSSTSSSRTAIFVVLGILAVLWIIQVINNADHYRLSIDYAIQPRIAADLPYIFTAPFLHWSWAHIEGNSIPLVVLGFLAAYRSIPKFIGVTAIVIVTSGMAVWLVAPTGTEAVGASGVIFGWFGYVIVRGFFNHDRFDIFVGVLVIVYYLSLFSLLLPAPHLSYQDHIGGLIGGLLCGWAFRTRPDGVGTAVDVESPPAVPRTAPSTPTTARRRVEAELASLKEEIASERRHHGDRKDH
jgi:membrane associated rhomboid family serine protease